MKLNKTPNHREASQGVVVTRTLEAAAYYLEDLGCSVIPLEPGGKRPVKGWKEYQQRLARMAELPNWPAQSNLGLVTGAISGLVVVDCESREDAEWFYRTRAITPVISQTPRGYHFFFRHPGDGRVPNAIRVENRYDIRADEGYVVAPPSIVRAAQYHFLPGCGLRSREQLPYFSREWLPIARAGLGGPEKPGIRDARKYIATIHAIGGSGGHNATWRVANRLKAAGLDQLAAWELFTEWNKTNASPPWTEAELRHKIRQVYR